MTCPFLRSSAVRLETTVTSKSCSSNPNASCRPAWPAPTISALGIVHSSLCEFRDSGLRLLGAQGGVPAVDGVVGAGHKRRVVRAQEQHDLGDLRWIADTPQDVKGRSDAVGLGTVVAG